MKRRVLLSGHNGRVLFVIVICLFGIVTQMQFQIKKPEKAAKRSHTAVIFFPSFLFNGVPRHRYRRRIPANKRTCFLHWTPRQQSFFATRRTRSSPFWGMMMTWLRKREMSCLSSVKRIKACHVENERTRV